MSREFNYKRAHREWAVPEFIKLGDDIKALYRRVQVEMAEACQNKSLGLDWPADGSLHAAFAAVDPAALAHAAEVIHALGHWDYRSPDDVFPCQRDNIGGYWKFEKLAKQSLIDRGLQSLIKNGPDVEQFMDHKEGTDFDDDELKQILAPCFAPELILVRVTQVNWRLAPSARPRKPIQGHPFVIGAAHFPKDGGMYINVHQAGCAECGCSYEEHLSDHVAVLKRASGSEEPKLTPAEHNRLLGAKPLLEEHKLDGVVFVK